MGDEEAFFRSIARLKADSLLRVAMGKAARELAVREFSRDKLSAATFDVLAAAIEPDPPDDS